MIFLILISSLMPIKAAEPVKLDFAGETINRLRLVRVEPDGTFLLCTHDRVFHWNAKGEIINLIGRRKKEHDVINHALACYYDVENKVYWVSHESGFQSAFFDKNGDFLGLGYQLFETGKPAPVALRSFVVTTNLLMTTGLRDIDLWSHPNVRLLDKVSYELQPNQKVLVSRIGAPFYTITPNQLIFQYNYKLQWAVEDPYHGNLYVVDQMTPRIRHFILASHDDSEVKELEDSAISFSLTQYKKPPRGFSRIKNEEEFNLWISSWTRINGLYLHDKGFIVGYTITDPKDPSKSRNVAQVISKRGRLIGKMIDLDGEFMGVHNKKVYVFDPKPAQPEVRILDL